MIYENLSIIVAMSRAGGIGINNEMPWYIPEDLKYFRHVTSGAIVIMGRNTFESIGQPLPNRRNIVITRNPRYKAPGAEVAASLQEAIAKAGGATAFIIGGGQIFKEAIAQVKHLIVTHVDRDVKCDTFFPDISRLQWHVSSRVERPGTDLTFVKYTRFDKDFYKKLEQFAQGFERGVGPAAGSIGEFSDMAKLIGDVATAKTNGDALGSVTKFRYRTREILFEQLKNVIKEQQEQVAR